MSAVGDLYSMFGKGYRKSFKRNRPQYKPKHKILFKNKSKVVVKKKKKSINDKKIAQGGELITKHIHDRDSGKAILMSKVAAFNNYIRDYANTYTSVVQFQQFMGSNKTTAGGAGVSVSDPQFSGFTLNDPYDYLSQFIIPLNPSTSSKWYQRSSMLNITIVNCENVMAHVDFYLLKCRRDVPCILNNTANTAPVYQNLYNLIQNSITDQGSGAGQYARVGVSPFQLTAIVDYFKIIKVTKSVLPSGGSIRYQLIDKTKRLILSEEFYTPTNGQSVTSQTQLALRKNTYWVLPVFYGIPIHDSALPNTQVAIAPIKLDMVSWKTYDVGFVQDTTFTTSIATTSQVTPTTAQKSTTEETGLPGVTLGN